ncbi:glycosyltransferase [Aliarcobacter butzleri]|uniref:glycosyltransferase n=1 Tax=Aliarcobacter butzleri TaxID=28197 RepID=UPI001EDD8E74|nr:glycosyltransferase [Aliarcobacter butzleri]MCG3681413.1 glycosyltransferase [Aliarcobacter butzleri]
MKKIAILINSMEGGGAERVASILLNSWVSRYECHLIVIHSNIFYKLNSRINITYLNEDNEVSGIKKLLRLPIVAKKFSNIVIEKDFDEVISFLTRANYLNILASYISKHKTIISERAMPSLQYQNGLNGQINKFLIKSLYYKANLCIANSKGNKRDLQDNFAVKNIVNISNPFDIDLIHKLSNDIIDIEKKRFTFVTVGRLDIGKNHKLIIEAVKDFNTDLWIIGDGELKEGLQKYINELNLNDKVYLLGKKENPFSFLSKADCFVFSSNYEGFPNVLVEALACGLPIISTDCQSGPREILAPTSNISFQLKDKIEFAEYGVLTPIKNVEKLKEAMNLMINDENLRKNYQDKAKQRANDFKIEKIIKQYERILCAE